MRYQLIVLVLSCFAISSCEQEVRESKVPSVVKNALKAKHPRSANVEWEKHGSTYEAEFDWQGRVTSVKIEDAGKYMMEKQKIRQQEVPPAVLTTITASYTDYQIKETEKLVANNVTYYQMELDARGKEEIKLVLLDNGSPAKGMTYWD